MQYDFKPKLNSLKVWGMEHRKPLIIILGLAAIGVIILLAFQHLPTWKVWLAIWSTSVITPIVLGMLGRKIEFRWVVLWECVMFLPVVLILIFFVQDIRGFVAKSVVK